MTMRDISTVPGKFSVPRQHPSNYRHTGASTTQRAEQLQVRREGNSNVIVIVMLL